MQTPTEILNIGADVAKDEIVVACSEGSFPVRKLANQRTALMAFLKSLPPGSLIGMESTGIYHELFASLAHKLGFIANVNGATFTGQCISTVACSAVSAAGDTLSLTR